MEWKAEDIAQYFGAREYIDTLLIPLIPAALDNQENSEKLARQAELQELLVYEMEKQFKGRIFIFPSYYYLESADKEAEMPRLNNWVEAAGQHPFQHIFFLTHDPHWKRQEKELKGSLIWLPALFSQDSGAPETKKMIKEQMNQVSALVTSYWQ